MHHAQDCGDSNSRKQCKQQIAAADIDDTGSHRPHQHQSLRAKLDNARTFVQNASQRSQQQRGSGGDRGY
ncbi:hypothetical protein D3C81_1735150 [compost metagenome]